MHHLTLLRDQTGDQGTLGVLTAPGLLLRTIELPWRDNARNVSCIPAGVYRCEMRPSPRFGRDLYEVLDVPARSEILIHPANLGGDASLGFRSDLEGCIGPGLFETVLDGQLAVASSRRATKTLHRLLGGEPFTLTVREAYEESTPWHI